MINRIDEICSLFSQEDIVLIINKLGRLPNYLFRKNMYPELSELWQDLHDALDLKNRKG